jgi:hypothetical protein
VIFCARKHDHITPLLYELHWLEVEVEERIQFKLWVLSHRFFHEPAPVYTSPKYSTEQLTSMLVVVSVVSGLLS